MCCQRNRERVSVHVCKQAMRPASDCCSRATTALLCLSVSSLDALPRHHHHQHQSNPAPHRLCSPLHALPILLTTTSLTAMLNTPHTHLQMRVSKEVQALRDFESTLLKGYQAYLKTLLAAANTKPSGGSSSSSSARMATARVAVRCMGQLLVAKPGFNYSSDLLQVGSEAAWQAFKQVHIIITELPATTVLHNMPPEDP